MKNLRTFNSSPGRYKVWLLSFLAVGIAVLGLNLLAGPGIQGNSYATNSGIKNSLNQVSCSGNSRDVCISAPTVDLYPAGSEGASNTFLREQKDEVGKSIGGIITDIHGQNIQLRTSSGRAFTVIFPVPIQSWWNQNIGPNYGNYQIGLGDTVRVDYVESASQGSMTIGSDQIVSSVLAIDPSVPSSNPIRRYPNI